MVLFSLTPIEHVSLTPEPLTHPSLTLEDTNLRPRTSHFTSKEIVARLTYLSSNPDRLIPGLTLSARQNQVSGFQDISASTKNWPPRLRTVRFFCRNYRRRLLLMKESEIAPRGNVSGITPRLLLRIVGNLFLKLSGDIDSFITNSDSCVSNEDVLTNESNLDQCKGSIMSILDDFQKMTSTAAMQEAMEAAEGQNTQDGVDLSSRSIHILSNIFVRSNETLTRKLEDKIKDVKTWGRESAMGEKHGVHYD